jgi:iron uptake system component EfeO
LEELPVPVSGRLALLIAGFALAIAACSGSVSTPAPATPPAPGSSAETETKVAVSAKEYAFTPSTITVAAGAVRFVVTNTGNDEHEFEIFKGDHVVDEIEGLVPGLTKELPVTLAPGDYTFVCKLSGHDQLGMKGTLTVTGG